MRIIAATIIAAGLVIAGPAADASDGKIGEPTASSMTVTKKCDRIVKRVAATDRDGDLVYWKKVIRFRDCNR